MISLAIAVVIIAVLSVVVIKQLKGDSTKTSAPTASTSLQPIQPSSPQAAPGVNSSPTMTCDGMTASTTQPGWKATIDSRGLAYAVPPEWTVAPCGVHMGWTKPCPEGNCVIQDLSAVATVANPACEKQNIAMAGVTESENPDIRAALDEESKTVPLIYTQNGQAPVVDFAPVREFTIGNHPAVQTVAMVKGIATDACDGSSAFHSIVVTTVPNVKGSVVFVISLRAGATATPNPDVINKIVDTLRSRG
ncbi:MAG TPA: hypothetical protein VFW21_13475 [Mycobacterium sp.]|nr:hypothetical protein [Mycobacterium sp.]